MAFPDDFDDVVLFKIHPAVGIARLSNNTDDPYVFGDDPGNYKSNKLVKRQAVQFRIFAYGENHLGLGELTAEVQQALGVSVVWKAKVANRKIAKNMGTPLSGTDFVIAAEAASNDANQGVLTGQMPSFEDDQVPLGQITDTGLFVPPVGGHYRKYANSVAPDYPATLTGTDVADSTSDGQISAELSADGEIADVLPACIIVAPADFSPDTDEGYSIGDQIRDDLGISAPVRRLIGSIHNRTTNNLDYDALKPTTADYQPGFEACLGGNSTEVRDLSSIVYNHQTDPRIEPAEVRIKYRESVNDQGAVPGQLTSGLCSTWQGDFTACVGHWQEHLPKTAYLDENTQVERPLFRNKYADTTGHRSGSYWSAEDFNDHTDKMGVVRKRGGKYVETERDPGDDV